MVAANAGLIGMSKEHLAIALALSVPVAVCITKVLMDLYTFMYPVQENLFRLT